MSYSADKVMEVLRAGKPSASGWVRGKCPFCPATVGRSDRRGSLGVNSETGRWRCFRCGAQGRLKFADAAARLGHDPLQVPEDQPTLHLPADTCFLRWEYSKESEVLRPAWEYLQRRKVPYEVVEDVGIMACWRGRFARRVLVPLGLDWNRRTALGWVARSWDPHPEVPYLYPPGMLRGRLIFNSEVLQEHTDVPVLVVEGVFDALAHWPWAVALLGKPSGTQVEALALAKRPVSVVLDGDAHEEGWALAMRLRLLGAAAGSVWLPPKTDPDEIPQQVLARAAAASISGRQVRL